MTRPQDSILDLVSKYHPVAPFQKRVLENHEFVDICLADVVREPTRTAFRLRLIPGLGPKGLAIILATLHDALDDLLGEHWFAELHDRDEFHLPDGVISREQLEDFLRHFPRHDRTIIFDTDDVVDGPKPALVRFRKP